MKEKINNIRKKVTEQKIVVSLKNKTENTRKLLKSGQNGAMLLLLLYSAQFMCGCVFHLFGNIYPKILVFLATTVLIAIVSEAAALFVKILFGGGKRSRIYFLVAVVMSVTADINSVVNKNCLAIIIAILIPMTLDVFGRCLFGFFIGKNKKTAVGYVMLIASFLTIVLFGIFFRTDSFGKDVKSTYLALTPQIETEVPGFKEYLENGNLNVKVIDYGPDAEIVTECVDISKLATRKGIKSFANRLYFGKDLTQTPVAGRIWYPEGKTKCPVLFIVHGNHDFTVPSYLGYDYLGEYLASNGYVVVSVDENYVNELSNENDARAYLFLENIGAILESNAQKDSPIYNLIDPANIAVAGHSRGGESVSTAFLFNDFSAYPDNGNIKLSYDFKIKSVIAIAPTVDQYMPANHAVEIEDVNYLLIHGANDQDVVSLMGEKQYNNVVFSENSEESNFKAFVYILGANHGQFNTLWGRYDSWPGYNGYLNTANHLSAEEQQTIAKAYIRAFLDATMINDMRYANLLKDNTKYMADLPKTILLSNYMNSKFDNLCNFDDEPDINEGDEPSIVVNCYGMSTWRERRESIGNGADENYVLECYWPEGANPMIEVSFPARDITNSEISFRIADMTEDTLKDAKTLKYTVELTDTEFNTVKVETPGVIYPALAVQLYKTDVFTDSFEYKHQMETVFTDPEMFTANDDFNFTMVNKIRIYFDRSEYGNIIIDDIGITDKKL